MCFPFSNRTRSSIYLNIVDMCTWTRGVIHLALRVAEKQMNINKWLISIALLLF